MIWKSLTIKNYFRFEDISCFETSHASESIAIEVFGSDLRFWIGTHGVALKHSDPKRLGLKVECQNSATARKA